VCVCCIGMYCLFVVDFALLGVFVCVVLPRPRQVCVCCIGMCVCNFVCVAFSMSIVDIDVCGV
jgi:hypothetical protein